MWRVGILGLLSGVMARPTGAAALPASVLRDSSFCLGCHGPGSHAKRAAIVDTQALLGSAHQTLTCADCHQEVRAVPHQPAVTKVDCGRCHSEGTQRELISPTSLRISTHGAVRRKGVTGTPKCGDCHGTHQVLPLSAASSRLGREQIMRTCGGCHRKIAAEYLDSVHGEALLAGSPDVPNCESCHPEHPYAARLGVFQRGVVGTCVSCHEDPGLQEQYAIPGNRLASYLGSYHGAATQLGYSRTANCASCHGKHHILPSDDPRSTINPTNLPHTCGTCHPGVNENVARGKVHVLATRESASLLYYINLGFRWFTFAIIGALMGHIGLELSGRWRGRTGD
jgi:hypothetical protein